MEAKIFSYRAGDVVLQPINENIKISNSFNRKELLNDLKEILKEQNFKIDPGSVEYKIVDDQLFISGMAIADNEQKSIGFMTGR
ncbi:MAG TPA: hypothetical protein VGI43_06585 [Mucilaginibacter sp.]|jgi:hypothetical protein